MARSNLRPTPGPGAVGIRHAPAGTGRHRDGGRPAVPRPDTRAPRLRRRRDLLRGDRGRPPTTRSRDRGPDRRPDRRVQPGRRGRPDDRGGRRRRAGPDEPVGRRAEGLRRRPGDPLRHVPGPGARPGASCTAAPASGRRSSTTPKSSRSSTTTCCRGSRRTTTTAPCSSRSNASTRRPRRSTPQTLERARQIDAVVGLLGAPVVAPRSSAGPAGRGSATAAIPSTSTTRRSTWPARREALTPAGAVFVLAGGPSRRALTTALLDLASRGRLAFREETSGSSAGRKGRHRAAAGRAGSRDHGPPAAATTRDRSAQPEALALDRLRDIAPTARRLHRARRVAGVRPVGPGVRQGARGRGRRARLVPGEAVRRPDALAAGARSGSACSEGSWSSSGSSSRATACSSSASA